jgi:hypothetical protein
MFVHFWISVGDIAWLSCFVEIKKRAYQAIVRPTVEYVSSAWDPYQENHIKKIETVQRRSARTQWQKKKGQIRVITKLPNSEQSSKGKVKTHKYINRQDQSTTGKLWKQ